MTTSGPAPIPEAVQRLILLAIPSVPYLEALLLLRGAPAACWNAAQVGSRLYLAEKAAQALLDQLLEAGLVAPGATEGAVCYAPQGEHMRELVDGLAQAYSSNLIGVTELIHSKSNAKARQFADAFVFRKQPETN
jgi:hypothetical protein